MSVSFDDLGYLHLLWVVLLVVLAGSYAIARRRQALRAFADRALLDRLAPESSWTRPISRLVLQTLALIALVAAILHPRWGEADEIQTSRSIDVMILLDVSRSMLATDIAPNRLERARLAIRDDLLPKLAGDRVGLITFAGTATLACPLTNDYGFFRLALDDVTTRSAARGGTLIGDAIREANAAFDDTEDTSRLVILITDGEDQESFPVDAARDLWSDRKVPVVAMALGDEREGARIPMETGDFQRYEGQIIWSRANFDDLRRVAAASGLNAFLGVGTRDFDLGEIYTQIVNSIEFQQRTEVERIQQPSRYHLFAVLALLLIGWDSFLRDGIRRRDTIVGKTAREKAA